MEKTTNQPQTALEMLIHLKNLKDEIKGTDKPNYIAGPYFPAGGPGIEISTANRDELFRCMERLVRHEECATRLGTKSYLGNHSVEEWENDLKVRMAQLDRRSKLKKISALEAEVKGVATPQELAMFGLSGLQDKIANLNL